MRPLHSHQNRRKFMDTVEMQMLAWYDFRIHCWLDPEPRPKDRVNENEEDWDEYAEWHDRQVRYDIDDDETAF